MVHEQLRRFFDGFRRDAHPMAVSAAWSARWPPSTTTTSTSTTQAAGDRRFRLIAKMPTIAAWAYKYSIGQPFMYPRNDLSYAENFLYMLNAVPAEPYVAEPDPVARHGPHPDPARRP